MAVQKTIIMNMCMVYDDNGNILVQDRVKEDYAGIAFPGGKVEPGESFVHSVIREIKEETGLDIKNPILCGIKQWQTDTDVRYIVLLFKTNKFNGEIHSSDEGEVRWIQRSQLHKCKTTVDFKDMIQIFENEDLTEFYYTKENTEWKFNIY